MRAVPNSLLYPSHQESFDQPSDDPPAELSTPPGSTRRKENKRRKLTDDEKARAKRVRAKDGCPECRPKKCKCKHTEEQIDLLHEERAASMNNANQGGYLRPSTANMLVVNNVNYPNSAQSPLSVPEPSDIINRNAPVNQGRGPLRTPQTYGPNARIFPRYDIRVNKQDGPVNPYGFTQGFSSMDVEAPGRPNSRLHSPGGTISNPLPIGNSSGLRETSQWTANITERKKSHKANQGSIRPSLAHIQANARRPSSWSHSSAPPRPHNASQGQSSIDGDGVESNISGYSQPSAPPNLGPEYEELLIPSVHDPSSFPGSTPGSHDLNPGTPQSSNMIALDV